MPEWPEWSIDSCDLVEWPEWPSRPFDLSDSRKLRWFERFCLAQTLWLVRLSWFALGGLTGPGGPIDLDGEVGMIDLIEAIASLFLIFLIAFFLAIR